MTTIILTIIGILLAAAAALMVIFYGGDAFNAGSIGAQANTYQNAGTNVISAVQLAKADNVALVADDAGTANVNETLVALSPEYLAEVPALPAGSNASLNSATEVFTAEVVSQNAAQVCARINENLRNGLVATATTPSTSSKMGCYTDATAGETFFANI